MSRLQKTFAALALQNRCALIPFITAGDPKVGDTVSALHTLVAAGADVLELGVPFSDPMADGPVIQRASERALANCMTLKGVLDTVRVFRQQDQTTPIVLMGYANPIERMGLEIFAKEAQAAGVDGVLTVDYPPEEAGPLVEALQRFALDPIVLIAPASTPLRIQHLAKWASGYAYYVALKGVTGAAHLKVDAVAQKIALIKAQLPIPVAVGFGIRDAQSAQAVARHAEAVVIGSAIIQLLEETKPENIQPTLMQFIAEIRGAIDAVRNLSQNQGFF